MSTLSSEKKIELTIQAHLAHYQAIRMSIETELKRENDFMNFSIAIVVGSIALFTVGNSFVVNQYPLILLIISALLSSICWSLISMEMRLHDYRKYIHTTLKNKVEKLLSKNDASEFGVLGIELAELYDKQTLRSRFRSFLFFGHFLVIYIPDLIYIGLFISLGFPAKLFEIFILIFALLMAIIVPIGILLNASYIISYYHYENPTE